MSPQCGLFLKIMPLKASSLNKFSVYIVFAIKKTLTLEKSSFCIGSTPLRFTVSEVIITAVVAVINAPHIYIDNIRNRPGHRSCSTWLTFGVVMIVTVSKKYLENANQRAHLHYLHSRSKSRVCSRFASLTDRAMRRAVLGRRRHCSRSWSAATTAPPARPWTCHFAILSPRKMRR